MKTKLCYFLEKFWLFLKGKKMCDKSSSELLDATLEAHKEEIVGNIINSALMKRLESRHYTIIK